MSSEPIHNSTNEGIQEIIKRYLDGEGFSHRKITDTPTDDLMVVNRKYVNLHGTTGNRPVSSVYGQQYFDTTIGRPIFLNPNTGKWVDGAGSIS